MIRLRFNPELPNSIQTVTLGGTSYRIRTTWRERVRGWYLSLQLADGTDIALSRRITSSGIIVRDMARHDPTAPAGGVLMAVGKNKYAREDLGVDGGINVWFLLRGEWDIITTVDTSEDVLISS
jgi:hypothetical protein